jgi:dTDP-4-amino-4,6-dideoxygalactose transaminase
LPVSERVAETTLNLPLHQNLEDDDVQKVIDLVRRFFRGRRTERGSST